MHFGCRMHDIRDVRAYIHAPTICEPAFISTHLSIHLDSQGKLQMDATPTSLCES